MINIIFEDPNMAYRLGMTHFMTQIFETEKNMQVQIQDLDESNIPYADIIVKHFSAGEIHVCPPLLQARHAHSLIIGVYDCRTVPFTAELPLCISNIIFINRQCSLNLMKKLIFNGWVNRTSGMPGQLPRNCSECNHQMLSPMQINVAIHFHRGNDVVQIAREMRIGVKCVSAHKRKIMSKFSLNSDSELLTCLRFIKNKVF